MDNAQWFIFGCFNRFRLSKLAWFIFVADALVGKKSRESVLRDIDLLHLDPSSGSFF